MNVTKEIRVGAFLLVALAVVLFMVFTIGGSQKLFGDRVNYTIRFASTQGLYEGDPVLLTGVEIGTVEQLGFPERLDEKNILVKISVHRNAANRIRQDSRARLGSASIVYGKVVQITMGSPDRPAIAPGGEIPADESSALSTIVDSTSVMIGSLSRMISKMNGGQGAAGMLLNEPLELRQTLHNLAVASGQIVRMLNRLEQGRGALGSLVSDSTAHLTKTLRDLESAAADFRGVASALRGSEGTLGKLINDPAYTRQTLDDLRSAARSIERITAKIDTGDGTLGRLINDPELYTGLRDVVIGTKQSTVARWLIRNRRKAGENERIEAGSAPESRQEKSIPGP
jgi:phospholipid/cholesterol/gamma-HCH transport system substrate-binding protein